MSKNNDFKKSQTHLKTNSFNPPLDSLDDFWPKVL